MKAINDKLTRVNGLPVLVVEVMAALGVRFVKGTVVEWYL
jgi:hypothetical protein